MYPDSEANRKNAGPEVAPETITNPLAALNSASVGSPPGMVTVSVALVRAGTLAVAPVYRVATPVRLSAAHIAPPVGFKASPHGLISAGSSSSAPPGMSETRLRTA